MDELHLCAGHLEYHHDYPQILRNNIVLSQIKSNIRMHIFVGITVCFSSFANRCIGNGFKAVSFTVVLESMEKW